MTPLHQTLDLSSRRRVFVVGDIHGEYQLLTEELAKIQFNEHDALISVGDLVDRGAESDLALEWITKPWFYRVLGNHDIAPDLYLKRQFTQSQIDNNFGGAWFTSKPRHEIKSIATRLADASVALTIITPKQHKVGIVHADCLRDWNRHISLLDKPLVYDLSLWSREVINGLMKSQDEDLPFDIDSATVANIDHVFSGHTPLAQPFNCGNRSWIDTGACFGGKFTIWNIDDFMDIRQRA